MLTSSEILTLINNHIGELPYERKPYALYEPIKYVLSIGGKRIRPTLIRIIHRTSCLRHADWRRITTTHCCMTT